MEILPGLYRCGLRPHVKVELTDEEARELMDLGVSANVYKNRIRPLVCAGCKGVRNCTLGYLADHGFMNTVTRLPVDDE